MTNTDNCWKILSQLFLTFLISCCVLFLFPLDQSLHLHQDQQPTKSTSDHQHHHCCHSHIHHHIHTCTNHPFAQVSLLDTCVDSSDSGNRQFTGWHYCCLAFSLLLSASESGESSRNERNCFLMQLFSYQRGLIPNSIFKPYSSIKQFLTTAACLQLFHSRQVVKCQLVWSCVLGAAVNHLIWFVVGLGPTNQTNELKADNWGTGRTCSQFTL